MKISKKEEELRADVITAKMIYSNAGYRNIAGLTVKELVEVNMEYDRLYRAIGEADNKLNDYLVTGGVEYD